jgi:hypothetical protein
MVQQLKEKIKFWQEQGLTRDCARCKALEHEVTNILKCGRPCQVDKAFIEKHMTFEYENNLKKLYSGGKIEL